jgi:hypothetical protein
MVEVSAQGSHLPDIESLCRKHIKTQTLTEEAFAYMAKLVAEDCPRNPAEVFALLGDFLTDGMTYSDAEALRICEIISKGLLD